MENKLNQKAPVLQNNTGKILKRQKLLLLLSFSFCLMLSSFSQNYSRIDTIQVKANGKWLKNPWVGGHNYIQLSDIDMNFDGKKDLFVFDRTSHKVTTYINKGTPNTVDYLDSTLKYAKNFPHLEDWAILRDYNCDGKPDIFTYGITVGGIKVWKNSSSGGQLLFTLETNYIKSDYTPSNTTNPISNLYVSRVDIPTIDDIDGDGDLDVLTFDFAGLQMEYHVNQSIEKGYGCDSLIFNLDAAGGCWGDFIEDAVNCNITLLSCKRANTDSLIDIINNTPLSSREEEWQNSISRHSGNCSMCLDMDADGDKEILLGQISCCNMSLLTNGGSKLSAKMIAKNDSFPKGAPVNQTVFPCGYFVDVDNDDKRDLIVCPNAPNISLNSESIWYYKNTGADNAPVFSRVKRNLLQDEMIDVGEGAYPVFFDFDSDGLMDLLVSTNTMISDSCPSKNSYGVYAFKNIGNTTTPRFDLINTDYANLSIKLPNISSKHLAFGDTDGDGDADLYIGDYNGNIHFLNNIAGGNSPANFTYVGMTRDYATPTDTFIDIGSNATPQLIDVDRDGDLDLIIGERAGNLNYYENTGSSGNPLFSLSTSSFGNVDVMKPCCAGYSVPFMYESSGKYNLLVGSEASRNHPETGWIWHYKDIDVNSSSTFSLSDSLYGNIWEGQRMTVNGADINADGQIDLVIGNYAGGVTIYTMKNTQVSTEETWALDAFNFTVFPNPSSGNTSVKISNFHVNEKYFFRIYNLMGEVIHSQLITRMHSKIDKPLAEGVYSFEIRTNNFSKTKKIVVIK
jgi:hypothetical protein